MLKWHICTQISYSTIKQLAQRSTARGAWSGDRRNVETSPKQNRPLPHCAISHIIYDFWAIFTLTQLGTGQSLYKWKVASDYSFSKTLSVTSMLDLIKIQLIQSMTYSLFHVWRRIELFVAEGFLSQYEFRYIYLRTYMTCVCLGLWLDHIRDHLSLYKTVGKALVIIRHNLTL